MLYSSENRPTAATPERHSNTGRDDVVQVHAGTGMLYKNESAMILSAFENRLGAVLV